MKNFGKLCIATVVAGMGTAVMAQEQIIKIGHIGPTSGPQAHFGKDDENGVRMAIEDLNAKGMEIGGKKVKFVLVAEDDVADPKQGTAVAQKLDVAPLKRIFGLLLLGLGLKMLFSVL